MTRLRQMRGFTLIELIVVVIIIGVLAAIAAVAYNNFVGDARDKAVKATAIQFDKAITAKSVTDDKTPAALFVLAQGTTSSAYFNVNLNGATLMADAVAGTPKVVQVNNGTRAACINLGVAAGQNGRVTDGACSTTAPNTDLAVAGTIAK